MLNWEKCHFMANQGIVLGHIISNKGIKVDKAKIELISKLPSPTNLKTVRQLLRHAGFYRRFIKDFSKLPSLFISYWRRMPNSFGMKTARKSFEELKAYLTTIVTPLLRSDPIGESEPKSGVRDYLYYILYCTGTPIDLFFFRAVPVPVVYKQFL